MAGEPIGNETGPYCHACLINVTYELKSLVYHWWKAIPEMLDIDRPECERCEQVFG